MSPQLPRSREVGEAASDGGGVPVALFDDAARTERATGQRARRARPGGEELRERKGTSPYWAAARQRAEARRARLQSRARH